MNNNKPTIFLDLEGTLIKNWNDWTLLHNNFKIINKFSKHNIGIFSFAVHNDQDKDKVLSNLDWIMGSTGININPEFIITVPEMIECSKQNSNIFAYNPSIQEYLQLYGKERAFLDYCKVNAVYNDDTYHLLDDTVKNINYSIKTLQKEFEVFFHKV